MRTIETTVYTYDELGPEAQERARDWYRGDDYGLDYEWWDCTEDDMRQIAAMFGFDVDRAYFTGFWSQGDGACITGSYGYKPGAHAAVMAYAPQDKELHAIVRDLQDIQRRAFYQLTASVQHRGHYHHSMSNTIDVDHGWMWRGDIPDDWVDGIEAGLRAFMDWYYARLEREFEWLTADEQVADNIRANEYEFTVDGARH